MNKNKTMNTSAMDLEAILRDFIEWNNESFDKGYIPNSRLGMYLLVKQCEGKECSNEPPDSNCIKHDVTRLVCQLCKDTGWYFVPNFGGGGTTHRCLCGK